MCFAPRYIKAATAVPWFDCTNDASRFDTLCAARVPGNNNPRNRIMAARVAQAFVPVKFFSILEVQGTSVTSLAALRGRRLVAILFVAVRTGSAHDIGGIEDLVLIFGLRRFVG